MLLHDLSFQYVNHVLIIILTCTTVSTYFISKQILLFGFADHKHGHHRGNFTVKLKSITIKELVGKEHESSPPLPPFKIFYRSANFVNGYPHVTQDSLLRKNSEIMRKMATSRPF